jgi:hypothetical protein
MDYSFHGAKGLGKILKGVFQKKSAKLVWSKLIGTFNL